MPVHHRLRLLAFPMRASRLCSLWPGMRPLRFRRIPFGRDVAFDPGGATAPRVLVGAAHVAFAAYDRLSLRGFKHFVAQSHTSPDRCVRFAPAVADDYATLTTGPRATT